MKSVTKLLTVFLLLISSSLFSQQSSSHKPKNLDNPNSSILYNLQIDTLTSVLTWQDSLYGTNPSITYFIFLDNDFVDLTADTSFLLPYMEYGTDHEACVKSHDSTGLVDSACVSFTSGYLEPPRNLDGETFDDAVHIWWEVPLILDSIPSNLLSYNVYRNDSLLANIPFVGEDTTHYYDLDLAGNCPQSWEYQYKVTALYDLEPYGQPGDTGESYYEGPLNIMVQFSSPFPFIEQWNSGSFDLNFWEHDINWSVDDLIGNPEPTAVFSGSPTQSYYSSSIISFCIDGHWYPTPWIDGQLWLDFDLKLESNVHTGVEKFQVNTIINDTAYSIATFSNIDGSFDWQHYHFNITDLCFGKYFKIEFDANGAISSSIDSWQVDNIMIYRTCAGPTGLSYEYLGNDDYLLKWKPPYNSTKSINKSLQGYLIYQDQSFLDETPDTFFTVHLPTAAYYEFEVSAVYEDCHSDTLAGPIIISTHVFLDEPSLDELIRIFPNPAKDILNIQCNRSIMEVRLFDLLGNQHLQTRPNQKSTTLNTSSLQSGVYTVRVELEDGFVAVRKVIVSRE